MQSRNVPVFRSLFRRAGCVYTRYVLMTENVQVAWLSVPEIEEAVLLSLSFSRYLTSVPSTPCNSYSPYICCGGNAYSSKYLEGSRCRGNVQDFGFDVGFVQLGSLNGDAKNTVSLLTTATHPQ